jgi:hypothetical protein
MTDALFSITGGGFPALNGNGGDFAMNGGTITGNIAGDNGGGVPNFYSIFTMNGRSVTGGHTGNNGSGVFCSSGGGKKSEEKDA